MFQDGSDGPLTYSAERWKLQQSIARYTSFLNYPSGGEPGHPGLQARPVTSPKAIGHLQTVPAVNCQENAPVSQTWGALLSLLIRQDPTAQHQGWVLGRNFKNPSVYHHTVSCTIELSLQSSITFIRPSKSQSQFWDTFWTSIPPQTSLSTLNYLFHNSDPPSKVYRTRFHHKIYRKSFFHNQIAIDMTYKLLWKSDSKVVHKSLFLIQKEAIIVLKPSRVSLNLTYYGSQ